MKRTRVLLASAAFAAVAVFPGMSANPFATRISRDQRVLHALNRLTYGPRSGDAAAVGAADLLARMNFAVQLGDNRVPGMQVDRVRPAAAGEPAAGIAFGSPEFQKR